MGIINMLLILMIALVALVQADKITYVKRKYGIFRWKTKYHRLGSLEVRPTLGKWLTYYTSRQHRWVFSWPFGTFRVYKQSGGGTWTRCVRKFWNLRGALKTVTYNFTNSGRCHLGIRRLTDKNSY